MREGTLTPYLDSVVEGDLLYGHPNSTAFGFNLPPIKKKEHLVLQLPVSTATAGMAFSRSRMNRYQTILKCKV